jgi:hypothetical protein
MTQAKGRILLQFTLTITLWEHITIASGESNSTTPTLFDFVRAINLEDGSDLWTLGIGLMALVGITFLWEVGNDIFSYVSSQA